MQTVSNAIDKWEAGNIATEREYFQGVLSWQDQLFTDLQFLYGMLNDGLPRVTEGMKAQHADLKGAFDDAMGARDAVVEEFVQEASGRGGEVLVLSKMNASNA